MAVIMKKKKQFDWKNVNNYWNLMNNECHALISMVCKAVYLAQNAPEKLPGLYTERPFTTRHLLVYLTLVGHNTTAYRRLTAENFVLAQTQLEDFIWRQYPHIPQLLNSLDSCGVAFPSTEKLLEETKEVLQLDFIDSADYAAEEKFGKFDIFVNAELKRDDIKSHHLLLASLAQCACCPFSPTSACAKAFGNSGLNFYYSTRRPKSPDGPDSWIASSLIRINKTSDGLRVFLEKGYGTFDEVGSKQSQEAKSRLFLSCNPPVFLKDELNQFTEIINEIEPVRERLLQRFLEEHSQFLRILGFAGFRPQVRLTPPAIELQEHNASLIPDFIVEQVIGKSHAIVELKKAQARMTSGTSRKRPSSALSAALRQLEDYYAFFQDREYISWFRDIYGEEIREPELVLIMGNENVASLGLNSIIHSPTKNLPIRVVSYRDIELLAKMQGLVVDNNNPTLEI
jgi:hypothetical protein